MTPPRDSLPAVLRWTVRIAMALLALGVLAAPAIAQASPSAGAARVRDSATAQPDSSAPYAYLKNYHSGKCLEVPAFSTTAGTQLDQWSCNGGTNQLWRPQLNASGNHVFINEHSGQCINVRGYGTSNGAAIQQWPCNWATATTNEIWYPYLFIGNMNSLSWYEWAGLQSNKCLNVSGDSTANGAKIILWDCIPTASNEWFALPYAS